MNDDPFDSSRARSLIEGWYPSPIARAFARAIARPEDAGASTRLASVTIQFLALVALRDLLARPDDWAEETPAELERLRRPLTDGAWLGLLRHALGRGKARAFDPELATTFLERGLDARLGEVVSLRNRIVHDNTQDALPELKRALARALGDLSSLRSLRLVVPREQVSGSEGEIAQYRATLYRGFASPFPTVLLRTEARLEAGRPYLARSGSEEVLALSPCFIEAAPAGAGERDLFLLSHREKQRVVAAGTDATELDAKVARDADLALEQLVKRTAKRTGRTTVKRFEVGGDALVARRRLAAGDSVDRYRVVRFIASGGMADVYEVEDAEGRPAALKMLSIELARSDETLRRFIAEVSRARLLGHPNVVRYVDHGETEGDHWLALELASGWPTEEGEPARDLARLIRSRRPRGEPVPEAVVLGVALDVAQGLQAIHEKGIVHRDLKPANVLLFSEGGARRAKVADFGVSRERAGETLTLTGFSVGTPEYMAPEQAEGRAHGTETEHSVDLYALGVVLYELASGDVPFRGATPLETAHLHVKRKPEGLKQRAPGVSAGLARIVMKLLHKDPKTRYRSAADLYRDLRQLEAEPGSDPAGGEEEALGLGPGFRFGSYRLGEEVARDAEAIVFAATDERTGEAVRLGVLSPGLEASPESRRVAVERLKTAARVRHPALLAVREVESEEGYTYFVTDAPTGKPLTELGAVPLEAALRLVLEIAGGLYKLETSVPHGRVTPENVWLDAGTSADAERSNPFLDEPVGRPQLGRIALVEATAPATRDAPGRVDPIGIARVLLRLATGKDGATPPDLAEGGPELRAIVEAALSGGYVRMRGLGPVLATSLRRVQAQSEIAKVEARERAVREALARAEEREREARRNLALTFLEKAERATAQFDWLGAEVLLAHAVLQQDSPATRQRLVAARARGARHLWTGARRPGCVTGLAFSPDGALLAAAGSESGLRLLSVASGASRDALVPPSEEPVAAAFSPDGTRVAAALAGCVRIFSATSGEVEKELRGHAGEIEAVAWSPDGRSLAAAGTDRMVRVHDVATGAVRLLAGHEGAVHALAWHPSGELLVSASADGTLRVLEPAAGRAVQRLASGERPLGVAFSPDGALLASVGARGTLRLLDAREFAERLAVPPAEPAERDEGGVAFDPGSRLVAVAFGRAARLLDAATGELVRTFEGHENDVWRVAFSPDGRLLATSSWDRSVRVFDAATGKLVLGPEGHAAGILALAPSPDGKLLATASGDRTVALWDAATGELVRVLGDPAGFTGRRFARKRRADDVTASVMPAPTGHEDEVRAVAWSPDGAFLASASSDRTALVWDAVRGTVVRSLAGHELAVTAVAFSPVGAHLATASEDATVRLWDAASGAPLRAFQGHAGPVRALAWSPDGRLASGGDDGKARLWDEETGEARAVFSGHEDAVHAVAWSPDGRRLASGSMDRTVRLWDVATGHSLGVLAAEASVFAVAFGSSGRRLAAASGAGARIFDVATGRSLVATGEPLLAISGHEGLSRSVAWLPRSERLATAGLDRLVRLYEVSTGQSRLVIKAHGVVPVLTVAWSPEGRVLATGSRARTVKLWNAETGEALDELKGHGDQVLCVAFARGVEGLLASASQDGTARLWRLPGRESLVLAGHAGAVTQVAFAPRDELVATLSADRTVRLWDPASGALVRVLEPKGPPTDRIAWSPDGSRLAVGGQGGEVRFLDPRGEEPERVLAAHEAPVVAMAWTSGLLVTGALDGIVRLWDPATLEWRGALEGHAGTVRVLAFSPDGQLIATGSADRTVRVWTPSGRVLATLEGHEDHVTALSWHPGSGRLASSSFDTTVRVWDARRDESILAATPDALRAEAEERTGLRVKALRVVPVEHDRLRAAP